VIAIDGESEKCFLDPQNSPKKKKPLSHKKALIKREARNQAIVTSSDKENQPLESNKPSSPSKIKRVLLPKEKRNALSSVDEKQKLSKHISSKGSNLDMKSSNEVLSKKELDQALWEDYCNLRTLFEMSLEDDSDDEQDFSKAKNVSKKKYLDVIELE